MRIFNEFLSYVRNIFAFILLPWYFGNAQGEES